MVRKFGVGLCLLIVSGCAPCGVIENTLRRNTEAHEGCYSIQSVAEDDTRDEDLSLMLAFSGGGTRAAALAYGVLKALADTRGTIDGRAARLRDQIDAIGSVSGASFTAAYFVQTGFNEIQQPKAREFVNRIPTSFALTEGQVDALIGAGRDLLRRDPEFQRFLAGLNGYESSGAGSGPR